MDNQVSGGKAFVTRFSRLGLIKSFALGKIPYVPRTKPREQWENNNMPMENVSSFP